MQETKHYGTYVGAVEWTRGSAFSGGIAWEPARPASSTRTRTGIDRVLVRCNFLVWFVNLAIILPRALG